MKTTREIVSACERIGVSAYVGASASTRSLATEQREFFGKFHRIRRAHIERNY
jgi:hypothetical protein